MNKYYYKKHDREKIRRIVRYCGLTTSVLGFLFLAYFSFPLLSWKIYLAPVYASQGFMTPIPKTTVLNGSNIQSLLAASVNSLGGVDYSDAQNWFPTYRGSGKLPKISFYTMSIPKIRISKAFVSTIDYNVDEHLINYGGTSVPPEKGNAVIFGHSTLPQLFNQKNYKTILANAHTLKIDDKIIVHRESIDYTYKIVNIKIVEPSDTTPLTQEYDDSYLTIITCTPPGTVWERLVLKARLEKL